MRYRLLLMMALVAVLNLASRAHAQTGGGASASPSAGYDLTWSTIDGGGYTWSEGGGYSLGGTVGQPDAGTLTGGGYTLLSGFWGGGAAQYGIYLPLALRNYP